jgi:hypothetical protein
MRICDITHRKEKEGEKTRGIKREKKSKTKVQKIEEGKRWTKK